MKELRHLLGRAYGRIVGFFLDRSVVHGIVDQRLSTSSSLIDLGNSVLAVDARLDELLVDVSALRADVSALAKDMEVVPALQADVSALASRTGELDLQVARLTSKDFEATRSEPGTDGVGRDRRGSVLSDVVALASRDVYARSSSELLLLLEDRVLALLEGIGAPGHTLPDSMSLVRTATVVGDLLMPEHDRFILPVLDETGEWEPEECELIRGILKECEGDLLVDIGAHVGYLTHVMSECSDLPILAVEAEPLNAGLLAFNLIRNGHNNVLPVHAAAGSTTALTDISIDPTNTGGHKAFFRPGLESSSIGRIALDDLLPPEVRVHFVKIDVEGMEQDVIRGMERIITDHRPTILAEFYPMAIEEAREEPTSVLNYYRAIGFRTVLPQHDGCSDAPAEEVVALARSAEGGYVTMLLVAQ